MVMFYKTWKTYNEIQLTRNKMDLNNRIMKNQSTLPRRSTDYPSLLACLVLNNCFSTVHFLIL